jgi:hypothetical protein
MNPYLDFLHIFLAFGAEIFYELRKVKLLDCLLSTL